MTALDFSESCRVGAFGVEAGDDQGHFATSGSVPPIRPGTTYYLPAPQVTQVIAVSGPAQADSGTSDKGCGFGGGLALVALVMWSWFRRSEGAERSR